MTIYRMHYYNSRQGRTQFISLLIIEYVNVHNTLHVQYNILMSSINVVLDIYPKYLNLNNIVHSCNT